MEVILDINFFKICPHTKSESSLMGNFFFSVGMIDKKCKTTGRRLTTDMHY